MEIFLIIVFGLLILAVLSGMLGLGVAFAAVPFFSLFLQDLVHQFQPLTRLLNRHRKVNQASVETEC